MQNNKTSMNSLDIENEGRSRDHEKRSEYPREVPHILQ